MNYNPNFPALFSLNKLPSRIYRLTICTDRCPVWFMIDPSDAPAMVGGITDHIWSFRELLEASYFVFIGKMSHRLSALRFPLIRSPRITPFTEVTRTLPRASISDVSTLKSTSSA